MPTFSCGVYNYISNILVLLYVYVNIFLRFSDMDSTSPCLTKPLDMQSIVTPNRSVSGIKSLMEVNSHPQMPPKPSALGSSNPISIINHSESQKYIGSNANLRATSKFKHLQQEISPSSLPSSIQMPCGISNPQENSVSKSSSSNFLSSFLSSLKLGSVNTTASDTDKKVLACSW